MSERNARLAIIPFALYALYSLVRHDLRIEMILVLVAVIAFALIGPRSRSIFAGLLPIALVGLLYDGMRLIKNLGLTEARVHVCDLRGLESTVFGSNGNTLHDYFYVHHWPAMDLICAVPYATFILWCAIGAIILYRRDRASMLRFSWGFFTMNVMGFITYHLVPAAPPWYFHTHGCVVDLAARASEGPALARVDAYLGIAYFHGMYAKASSVFGAVPSLHCAYPTIMAIQGWRTFGWPLRIFSVLYAALMVFSAMYLDHHWLIDACIGILYAVLVSVVFHWIGVRWKTWSPRSSGGIASPGFSPSSDSASLS